MISIPRTFIRQLRAVLRRAGIKSSALGGYGHRLLFQATPDKLTIRALSLDVAIECFVIGSFDEEQLIVPLEFLEDWQGRVDDPVILERRGKDRFSASWSDGRIPQRAEYATEPLPKGWKFPEVPSDLHANPSSLWAALRDAAKITDAGSSRYSLGCIQLRGDRGQLVATDGRQVLMQEGFDFSWEGELLVPPLGVLGCRELAHDSGVAVGHTDDWAVFGIGNWTIWSRINKEGRFPRVDDIVQPMDRAIATASLVPRDAEFLAASIHRLPGDKDFGQAVTLDLDSRVVLRAKSEDCPITTELVLSQSATTGEPVRVNMNRSFLARAIELGFNELHVFGPTTPIQCRDDHRTYLWAVLDHESALPAVPNAIRIDSATAAPPSLTKQRKNRVPMPRTQPTAPAGADDTLASRPTEVAATQSDREETSVTVSPIQQAVVLRQSLAAALGQANKLIRQLKRQKRQSKLVESTLASLRELHDAA
ncbi:MAG: hypothetical protein HYX69_00450 [Planctomycetia bacterium]|nr:hypothetical protein [Planctomycetia bacterium]